MTDPINEPTDTRDDPEEALRLLMEVNFIGTRKPNALERAGSPNRPTFGGQRLSRAEYSRLQDAHKRLWLMGGLPIPSKKPGRPRSPPLLDPVTGVQHDPTDRRYARYETRWSKLRQWYEKNPINAKKAGKKKDLLLRDQVIETAAYLLIARPHLSDLAFRREVAERHDPYGANQWRARSGTGQLLLMCSRKHVTKIIRENAAAIRDLAVSKTTPKGT